MAEPERLYDAIDLAAIKRFVEEPRRMEDLHLEFKAPHGLEGAKVPLAKALSGFANSDGGVIVWGVEAIRRRRVDAACGLKPIEGIESFVSQLETLTGQAVSPFVDGVLHKVVAEGGDKGYAVTLVPVSDCTPHVAKLGEDRYYKRTGSSFYRMEHFDLEDMFGRRPRPKLDLYVDVRRGHRSASGGGRRSACHVIIGILNTGRRYAAAPYLIIRVNAEYQGGLFGGSPSIPPNNIPRVHPAGPEDPAERRFAGGPEVIVHPDVPLEVAGVQRTIHENDSDRDLPDLRIDFCIRAMDARPVEGFKDVPGSDILECAAEGFRVEW